MADANQPLGGTAIKPVRYHMVYINKIYIGKSYRLSDIRLVGTGLDGRRSSTCSSTRTTEPFSPGADANTNKIQLVPQMLQNPPFLAEDHRLLPHLLLPPRLLLDRLPRHLLPGLQCCLDIIAKLFFEL